MTKIHLIEGPVDANRISALIAGQGNDVSSGAHSVFIGRVRADIVNGRTVEAIEYSAYQRMVDAQAEKIISEITAEYNDVRSVEIIHSSGKVKAGEISLYIGVSAGHRRQANDACRKTLELVKEKLPVWKKEIFQDGSSEWK